MSFASASDVFTNYQNFSNWDESVAVAFTFFGAAWSISGWASPAFLVEETHNGHRTVAKSIIISFIAMAWIGAAVCLVIAFCIVDIAAAAADPTYVSLDSFLRTLKLTAGDFDYLALFSKVIGRLKADEL
jgi:choline transport protein